MKDTIRREPVQLLFWTPNQLHLMQPGRQEAADRTAAQQLRYRTEYRPRPEPYWVKGAYNAFWNGEEWG